MIKSTELPKEALRMGEKHRSINPFSIGGDPFLNDVLLWLKGDDFSDSSSFNRSLNLDINSAINTEVKKYGVGCFDFTLTSSALFVPNLSGLVSLGETTLEFWFYKEGISNNHGVCQFNGNTTTNYQSNYLTLRDNNLAIIFAGSSIPLTYSNGVWNHIAYSFKGNSEIDIFVNGMLQATVIRSYPILDSSKDLMLGRYYVTTSSFGGYIDSLRITKAIRYTSSFDPESNTYLSY